MEDLDEDNLRREEETDAEASVDETPVKRGPGRPRGLPKTGGAVKGKAAHAAIDAYLLKVASGQRVRQSGPSGKPIWRYPALHEALRAAELLKSTAVTHVTPEPTTAPKAAEEVEPEALRKALAEHIAATTPPVPREIDVIDYSMEPTVDADGGGVTTSPEETAKFDAEIAAKKSNRSDDSKIHPNGFSWLRRRDKASNRGVYDLYNPAGLLCGTRQARERADKWCENEGCVT